MLPLVASLAGLFVAHRLRQGPPPGGAVPERPRMIVSTVRAARRADPAAAEGIHPGAGHVSRWRREFFADFVERLEGLR